MRRAAHSPTRRRTRLTRDPVDLDAEELAELSKLIGAKSGVPTPIPQLVIEAMQRIRPDGKKREKGPRAPAPRGTQPAPRPRGRARRAGQAPAELVIDLDGYVADHAQIDRSTRKVTFPPVIEIRGVTLELIGAAERMVLRAGEDAHWVRATFRVHKIADANA